jgi:hypothetical protein
MIRRLPARPGLTGHLLLRMPAAPRGASAVAAALLAAATQAAAIEPMAPYDSFAAPVIDRALWAESERVRQTRNSSLNLVQRDWGSTASSTGLLTNNFGTNLANPGRVTQLRASLRVNAIEATGCAGNPAPTQVRARLVGSFFNTGQPVAGSQTGDAVAQVLVRRLSNSTQPAGVLDVIAVALVCQNSDCSQSTNLGPAVPLGTVPTGQAITVQMEWDKATRQFSFSRDAGAFIGSVGYTVSDTALPGSALMQLGTRTDVAACTAAPRPTGFVDATFDAVEFNRSAAR